MARPIEPTPTLKGKDAKRLLRDLADVCSPEEARRRQDTARSALDELTRPKFEAQSPGSAERESR
jgi:hypothetical protein